MLTIQQINKLTIRPKQNSDGSAFVEAQIQNAKIIKDFSQKRRAVRYIGLYKALNFFGRRVARSQDLKLREEFGIFFRKLGHYFQRDKRRQAIGEVFFHVLPHELFDARALVFFRYELDNKFFDTHRTSVGEKL